ncbi:MAG: archaellin/type IV pilin N-terminal domain-containing protein [Dehalococcoidia bacterium]
MLKRLLSRMYRNQKGITGLETAIILIAFVVVAAVFAYTVLSAGLFATEQSSEAVYSGLQEARSTMEIRGGVSAYASVPATGADASAEDIDGSDNLDIAQTSGMITRIQFAVANVLGGDPIDLTPHYTAVAVDPPSTLAQTGTDNHETIITYQDKDHYFSDCTYTVAWIGEANQDNLLEANEKALITVWLMDHAGNAATAFNIAAAGNNVYFDEDDDTNNTYLTASETFTLEVKSPNGAVLPMTRTLPDYLDPVNDLH